MKIAVIAHLKYPIGEPFSGGLENHTHMLTRKLRERGHDVVLFASTRSDPALGLEAICDETALLDVGTAEARDIVFFREHHAYLALMQRLRRSDFDIVHNNSLHYLPVSMADSLPMPMVTTLHTPPFCWLESGIRLCTATSARFVAVSRAVHKSWQAVAGDSRVILNGIDLDRFAFAPLANPETYLAWQGRIVPEKGLHFAIDAALQLGIPLRIAGPNLDTEYFATEIAPKLGPDIRYEGHLGHRALSAFVGGASALLVTPCWEEPYGLVVAEALACGVPVAAFDRGAMREILTPESGVLATPDDAADLARAAGVALGLSRTACRRRAEQACDADRMVDGYEALYDEMLADPGVQQKAPFDYPTLSVAMTAQLDA